MPAFLDSIGIVETALQAATIQGFFGLLGLVLAGLIGALTYGANRRADRRLQKQLRQERTTDLQSAIRAEVRAHWYELDRSGPLERLGETVVDRIDQGRWVQPGYTPFIVREAPTVLRRAIEGDLALLDRPVIQATMDYYRQLALVGQFADDLRSARFEGLAADRKIEMVRAYFGMLGTLKLSAAVLNETLERTLRLPKKERDISMRGGTPGLWGGPDREPASERSARSVAPTPEKKLSS